MRGRAGRKIGVIAFRHARASCRACRRELYLASASSRAEQAKKKRRGQQIDFLTAIALSGGATAAATLFAAVAR